MCGMDKVSTGNGTGQHQLSCHTIHVMVWEPCSREGQTEESEIHRRRRNTQHCLLVFDFIYYVTVAHWLLTAARKPTLLLLHLGFSHRVADCRRTEKMPVPIHCFCTCLLPCLRPLHSSSLLMLIPLTRPFWPTISMKTAAFLKVRKVKFRACAGRAHWWRTTKQA